MPEHDTRRTKTSRTPTADPYQDLIHLLNLRYREQWERAEQLQKELAEVYASRAWQILTCWQRVKTWFRARSPGASQANGCQVLTVKMGQPSGRVSIIIPFKDRRELLHGCLKSLRATTYRHFDVVLVDNGSVESTTRRYLRRLKDRRGIQIVRCPEPFNFSRLCNQGASRASGDYLLFLNNDMEVLSPDWLEHLLLLEHNPEIGVAGGTLFYPDGTIQHAGLFKRPDGLWAHVYRGCPQDHEGEHGELRHVRTVPAVTGACLLIQRDRFLALGGFDEQLPVTFGDVDLCRRVREQGQLVVVTPHARLLHFESLTRGYAPDCPRQGHLTALSRLPGETRSENDFRG